MATKPCKDCGEPISPIAYKCPHCMRVMGLGVLDRAVSKELVLVIIGITLTRTMN